MEERNLGVANQKNPAVSHELSDVNVRGVLYFAVWLTIAAIIIHVLVWLFYDYFGDRATRTVSIPQEPVITGPPVSKPQLQVEAESELSQLRTSEEQVLHTYGWIDQDKGIVRIPIERAMEIIATQPPFQKESKQRPAQTRTRKN